MNRARNKITALLIVLIVLTTFIICINVNAYDLCFVGYTSYTNNTLLYNATNTYNYAGPNTEHSSTFDYFDLTQPNLNQVSNDAQITVLTHGLGGGASHWSNDGSGSFAYDSESLISRLAEQISLDGVTNVKKYWAKMQSSNSFKLYDLDNPNNTRNGHYYTTETVSNIYNITDHIIIVFEATNNATKGFNYIVYEEFNYMLSMIVSDVKATNGGILPKINLIGHSRGGLTNLEYTLDHPDMVASLFSLGTPFFGSAPGKTSIGSAIVGESTNGLQDIIDPSVYGHYFLRWSNNNEKYENKNYHALGGYSSTGFVFDALIDDVDKTLLVEYQETLKEI